MNKKFTLLIGVIFALFIILGSIMMALSTLKDEAINNYVTISKLNAKAFSKELNQDINNIEQTIVNITSVLNLYTHYLKINKRLKEVLKSYPQVRSINVLKDGVIIYSSNPHNIDITLKNMNFFPKPIFDEDILKISTPWIGRDFIDGNDIYTYEETINNNEAFFIPISKTIQSKRGEFTIIVNLNSDYFANRFLTNINSNEIIFELIRLDGILLLSTDETKSIGKHISEKGLLEKTIEHNEINGIETIDGVKYIVTYLLTKDYPINLAVKLDYDKSLLSWNKKQYDFFIITTTIVIISIMIALTFFYLYNRKKEEEILLHKLQIQEHEKFKLLFQDAHFLSAVLNQDGVILELNNAALEFLKQPFNELKNRKFWELDCWQDNEKKLIQEMICNNENKSFECELIALDYQNNEKNIEFNLSSFEVENEKIFLALGHDITERTEKEKKLKQAYTVFSNTRDGIMITDSVTNLLDVNRAFEKITGYTKEEILNKKTNILKSNIHTKEFYKNMWDSILSKGYWEGEITNLKKNNESFTEWLTINTIYDEEGNVQNYIGVFSDITEQKIREKLIKEKDDVLYQQSKMAAMGEMIANIAHQWRQPLSAISMSATGLLLQKEMNVNTLEEEVKTLTQINESSQYLSRTIDDFRNFLKVDKQVKLFNLESAVKKAISLVNLKINDKDVKLHLELDELSVYGIKNEFIQVIINILNNARDAIKLSTRKKHHIFITISKDEYHIYIKIKDSAGGIRENILSRIFEPYFTTKHMSQGTGIGLYMSEEIIKNHMKGVLYIENEAYNFDNINYKGACFTIKIPFK